MTRTVLIATSPEPVGVSKTIADGFEISVDRVTYDGELGGRHVGYLFSAEVRSVTQAMQKRLESQLSAAGYTSHTTYLREKCQIHVYRKHYNYLWAALALSVAVLYQCTDVHKKPFERAIEQWINPAWRCIVFYFQEFSIPHAADEWRHIG